MRLLISGSPGFYRRIGMRWSRVKLPRPHERSAFNSESRRVAQAGPRNLSTFSASCARFNLSFSFHPRFPSLFGLPIGILDGVEPAAGAPQRKRHQSFEWQRKERQCLSPSVFVF